MGILKPKIHLKNGFTIVELLIVIAIIGILATISIVGYGSWRNNVVAAQVKNDLSTVASAMEDARTFGNGYPSTVPSTVSASSPNITLTPESGLAPAGYCVDGVSSDNPTDKYYIASESKDKGPLPGACADRPGATPAPTTAPTSLIATTSTSSQINLTWGSVSGTGITYTVQRATDSAFVYVVGEISGLSGLSRSSTSLSAATTYFYRVRADTSGGSSGWSNTATATTISAPAAPVVASSITSPASAVFTWPAVSGATGYTFQYNINGGSWQTGFTAQNTLTYTVSGGHNNVVNARVLSIDAGNTPSTTYGTSSISTPLWASLAYQNNWSDYGSGYAPGRFTKTSAGIVVLSGLLNRSGSVVNGETIATLPAGYRPEYQMTFIVAISGSGPSASMQVHPNGNIVVSTDVSGTATSLDRIAFIPAGSSYTWTNLALLNGWTNRNATDDPPFSYTSDSMGRIHIRGAISPGTTADGTDVTNLPTSPTDSTVSPKLIIAVRSGASGYNAFDVGPTTISKRATSVGSVLYSQFIYYPSTYSNWTTMTLKNGWVVHSGGNASPQYTKSSDNVVTLKGLIKSGSTSTAVVLFTLPVGYRPSARLVLSSTCADSPCRFDIQTNGDVEGRGVDAGYTSFSGINFVAEQ